MDVWKGKTMVYCEPNSSKLTIGSCATNQEQAHLGVKALLAKGGSTRRVPEHQLERLMACGSGCKHCKKSLQIERVKARLRGEFRRIASNLEDFDWYREDDEIKDIRKKERAKAQWQKVLKARLK